MHIHTKPSGRLQVEHSSLAPLLPGSDGNQAVAGAR